MSESFIEWQAIVVIVGLITAPLLALAIGYFMHVKQINYKKARFFSEWLMIALFVTFLFAVTFYYSYQ